MSSSISKCIFICALLTYVNCFLPEICNQEFWEKPTHPDLHSSSQTIWLRSSIFDTEIIDRKTGKFVSQHPWLVIFVRDMMINCSGIKRGLDHLAKHYDGQIQFAFVFSDG